MSEETQRRKEDHLRIPLDHDVQSTANPWDHIALRHEALGELDRDAVDVATTFLGRDLAAPIQITGMTGGAAKARTFNDRLAAAAAAHQVAMGVGSQRAALEDPALADTYAVIRDHDVPARWANLGLPQLIEWTAAGTAEDHAAAAIDMLDAHALCIHLNALQEAVMPEGDAISAGGIAAIERLCDTSPVPIIVKETGAGIDGATAVRLAGTDGVGVAAIDIGGLGGTSFAAVEHHRAVAAGDDVQARLGQTYWDWGNPAPVCVRSIRTEASLDGVPVVATGGLRTGRDALRALALGADLAGFAGTMFRAAADDRATQELQLLIQELKTGLYLAGCPRVSDAGQDLLA